MPLELLNTIATLATSIVIAATAIAALIQLRHMRAGNQITGQLAINALIQSEAFQRALVKSRDLPGMIDSAEFGWAFRKPVTPAMPPEVIEVRLAARFVGSQLENIGHMIRHGLTDGDLFIEQFANVVVDAWDVLEPYARLRRKTEMADTPWEDFELLTIRSRDWTRAHPTAFPHKRRLLPPWREIELPDVRPPDGRGAFPEGTAS